MKTYAMALDLIDDPEVIEEYKEHHRHVWPEVKQGLEKIGITEMKIFLTGCRLFMFLRTEDEFDLEKDFQSYTDTSPRARMWDDLMRNFQQKIPSAKTGDWWVPMEEVFNLEW
ncbi:MAG: L-rhamnose mutarotase [SAR202 cluster bacterium]|nr:L-rhamnose mutarotase [SAR202 cluster bacterium]